MNEISPSEIPATFSLSKFSDNKVSEKNLQGKEVIFGKRNLACKGLKPAACIDYCKFMYH